MVEAIQEKMLVLFGRVPSCDWVQIRLPAYWMFDLTKREIGAIETHLHKCRACAAEYEWIAEISDKLMCVRMAGLGLMSPEEMAERTWERIQAKEAEKAAKAVARKGLVLAWQRAAVLAGACLLVIAVSALAVIGARVWLSPSQDEPAGGQIMVPNSEPVQVADDVQPAETQEPEIDTPAGPAEPTSAAVSEGVLNTDLDDVMLKAQVEMLFPHTDEEYEQWARKEYPHIMWLYNILQEPSNGFDWYGTWQQLLIDSAEIFKFDWPMRLDDPNCIPSIKAMQSAAAVAGFAVELSDDGKWELPNVDFAEQSVPARRFDLTVVTAEKPLLIPDQERPDGYIEHLAADPDLTKTVLVHLSISSELVDTPEFDDLSDSAKVLLTQLCAMDSTECNVNTWTKALRRLFDSRGTTER